LPSIIPGYVYALVASIIVGTIVIAMCGLITANVKTDAEKQQLSNIAVYVATKSMEIMSNLPSGNVSVTSSLIVPPLIGNQRYWIRIQNDSSNAWVEVGFGATVTKSEKKAFLPSEVTASGFCLSDSRNPSIKYQLNSTGSFLSIFGGN
jgi:hypothetical protein